VAEQTERTDPFPKYDVLEKRDSPSWNEATRIAVGQRMSLRVPEGVLTDKEQATLARVVERVAPQPEGRPPANTLAVLMHRIARDQGDGYRPACLPRAAQAWRAGIAAIDAEAHARHDKGFAELDDDKADEVLHAISKGEAKAPAWANLPAKAFWEWRLIPDILKSHFSHPSLWSAIGFGGPASPRGYVRIGLDRRDPWEAKEAR
jgi:hypothetical protein